MPTSRTPASLPPQPEPLIVNGSDFEEPDQPPLPVREAAAAWHASLDRFDEAYQDQSIWLRQFRAQNRRPPRADPVNENENETPKQYVFRLTETNWMTSVKMIRAFATLAIRISYGEGEISLTTKELLYGLARAVWLLTGMLPVDLGDEWEEVKELMMIWEEDEEFPTSLGLEYGA